jgi:N-acetylneuraminic acid mutarotase
VTGGITQGDIKLSISELYDPLTDSWNTVGYMIDTRSKHTATLLINGKLLVAGGYNAGSLPGAELYDQSALSQTTPLTNARYDHSTTLLPNGKALVTGGRIGGSGTLSTVELYDPASGNWSTVKPMNGARYGHTATLLPNGKVLVAGGWNDNSFLICLATAEIYDPEKDTWSTITPMTAARALHTATLLPNGKALVAGGYNGSDYLGSAELYDPVKNSWSTVLTPMNVVRAWHSATILPNGKVLVAGGHNGSGYLSGVELYNPASDSWSLTGSMATARRLHSATPIPGGKVLIAGGANIDGFLSGAELYDQTTGAWNPAGSMTAQRQSHGATFLPNGFVLITGGMNGSGPLSGAELYIPATNSWSLTTALAVARSYHSATLLTGGKILVTGGSDAGGALSKSELYATGLLTATSLALGNLTQSWSGAQKVVTAATSPPGLTVAISYNGSATPPTLAGKYLINAAISDFNYQGTASGILIVNATLNVSLSGTGGGSVNSNPSGLIACTYPPQSGTSSTIQAGIQLTLTETTNGDSLFSGWGGACSGCDKSQSCQFVLDSTRNCTADFYVMPPTRIGGSYYPDLTIAYSHAVSTNTIQSKATTFPGGLNLNRNISVILQGGYDAGYVNQSGYSSVQGQLILGVGSLVVDRLQIQ